MEATMLITATKFRQNLYHLLDDVLKTGRPIEIERKGKRIKIILEKPKSKLSNLQSHNIITGNPEDLISIDWSNDWDEGKNL
jgi:hypothetical protein